MSPEQFKRKQNQIDGEAPSAAGMLDVAVSTYESWRTSP